MVIEWRDNLTNYPPRGVPLLVRFKSGRLGVMQMSFDGWRDQLNGSIETASGGYWMPDEWAVIPGLTAQSQEG